MNLNAYDAVDPIIKTWVNPNTKKLYSDVIPYYKYYTFLKRYNNSSKCNDYYIAFSNKEFVGRVCYKVYLTKSKSIKVDLNPIWDISNLKYITNDKEINIDIADSFEDGVIYYIDI